jgi:hypothetical protein
MAQSALHQQSTSAALQEGQQRLVQLLLLHLMTSLWQGASLPRPEAAAAAAAGQ